MKLMKKKKGFTLIELMAVIAIVAILAAVLVPTVSGYITRARKTAAVTQIRNTANAIASYNITSSNPIDEKSEEPITNYVGAAVEGDDTVDPPVEQVDAKILTSAELLYNKDVELINNLNIKEVIVLNSKEDILDRITIVKEDGKYVVQKDPKLGN